MAKFVIPEEEAEISVTLKMTGQGTSVSINFTLVYSIDLALILHLLPQIDQESTDLKKKKKWYLKCSFKSILSLRLPVVL